MSQAAQLSVTVPRSRGAALLLTAFVLISGLVMQLSRITLGTWRELRAPTPASPDLVFGLIAGIAGAGGGLWLLCALSVSAVAAIASRTRLSSSTSRAARRIAPAAVRNAVAALLGIVLVAAPTVAQASTASPVRQVSSVSAMWAGAAGSRADPASMTDRERLSGRAKMLRDFSPGWTPDRPRPSGAVAARERAKISVVTSAPRRTTTNRDQGSHVVVRRGDTLWSIAARHLGPGATDSEIAGEWPRWFRVNRHLIGADPHLLLPGERLRSPGESVSHSQLKEDSR